MDPELRKKIDKTYDLAQENHKMLKKIRHHMILGNITRAIYWVIIIAVAVGAYVFVQPYVESAFSLYQSLGEGLEQVRGFGDSLPFSGGE